MPQQDELIQQVQANYDNNKQTKQIELPRTLTRVDSDKGLASLSAKDLEKLGVDFQNLRNYAGQYFMEVKDLTYRLHTCEAAMLQMYAMQQKQQARIEMLEKTLQALTEGE